MRSKNGWFLWVAGILFIQASPLFAASKAPPLNFDLFGLPLSTAEQGLGTRADSRREALSKAFPQAMAGKKIQENNYSGVCFVSGPETYELAWFDSETEGYRFSVERFTDRKACTSAFNEADVFPTAPLDAAQFFPISRSHPDLKLGVTTLAQVRQEMGSPDYQGPDILVYPLKRDRAKEKGCQMNPRKGEMSVIAVQFHFKQGVLQSVDMVNNIDGEC